MTSAVLPPSFSPSVVLLVRETGERVHRHLGSILELAGPLGATERSVELFSVRAAGDDSLKAAPLPLRPRADEPADEPAPGEDLATALVGAARRVYSSLSLLAIQREGHAIGHALQVLIVGGLDDPWLGEVVATARAALDEVEQRATVCCLLDGDWPAVASAEATAGVSQLPADFSFLFTDRIVHPGPAYVLDPEHRRYVLAQGLFALVATGLSLDPRFAQLVHPHRGDVAGGTGTLRACLVTFPLAHVERCCAARLALELVATWERTLLRAPVEPSEAAMERSHAARAVAEIRGWLEDGPERPRSDPTRRSRRARGGEGGGHRWPGLAILRVRAADGGETTVRAHQQLVDATARLFGLFTRIDVDREAGDRPGRPWADVAYERTGRVPDVSWAWETAADRAWAAVPDLLVGRLRECANHRWSGGDRRLALLRSFVEECDDQLANLVAAHTGLREDHVRRYRERIDAYTGLASPWLSRLDEPPPDEPGAGDAPPPPPAGEQLGHLLDRDEDRIATALRERARAARSRVPPWWGVLPPALVAFAGACLFALATWRPMAGLPLLSAVADGLGLAAGLAYLALLRARRHRARAAEADLLRFLSLCYAHRGERFEDLRRVTALGPVQGWVRRTRHALEGVEAHLGAVGACLDDAGRHAEAALFDSPSGLYDVLVAEGARLVGDGPEPPAGRGEITLDGVLRAVSQRAGPGVEAAALSDAFLADLGGADRLLEMDERELADRVLAYLADRLRPALASDAVEDLARALRDPAVQQAAASQLESPLFPQWGSMQARQRYVCGRPPDDNQADLPPGRLVLARQAAWWLLVAVFAGDADATPPESHIRTDVRLPAFGNRTSGRMERRDKPAWSKE